MRRRRQILFIVTCVIALVGVVWPAHAQMSQLYEDFGVAPRDSGMGNVGTASSDDYSASFYNPAALVRSKGFSLDLGYKAVFPDLKMKIGRYDDRHFTDYPNTEMFLIGLTWQTVIEKLVDRRYTDRFTIGFVFAFSDYFKSFTVYYDPDTPYFYRYHDRYLNLLPIYVSLGVRITDWISVGVGAVPAPSDTKTDVLVDTHFSAPVYEYRATQGTITRSYGKVEPVVGVLARIPVGGDPDRVSIGVVWRDEVSTIDGEGVAVSTTAIHFGDQTFSLPPSETPILTLTGWTPMQIVGAVSWRPLRGATVAGDVLWKQWSEWKSFFIQKPDPPFHDTWNARLGGEYVIEHNGEYWKQTAIRAGGYREMSPVPDQNGPSNYLDPDKWVITAGVGAEWKGPFGVFTAPIQAGIAGQAHFMDTVHLHNKNDPDYPELAAWGEVYSVTATMGVKTK